MEELREKFEDLRRQEKWNEAAEVQMISQDEYPNVWVDSVVYRVRYAEEEREALEQRALEDRRVAHWVGHLKFCGYGGFQENKQAAYQLFCRAAAAGHLWALWWKGIYLSWRDIVVRDAEPKLLRCFEEAGARGLARGCNTAGRVHRSADRHHQAALWYQRGVVLGDGDSRSHLESLLRDHPMDVCPWGIWRPTRELHSFVLPQVRQAVKNTLLLCKRLRLSRYLALEVCSYVVTRSGW